MGPSLGTLGFSKIEIKDPESNVKCDVFIRSPIEVLRKQIRGASKFSTFFDPAVSSNEEPSYCHPMMSALGRDAVPAVKNEIMNSIEENISWNESNIGVEASFVGMIQLYSDKSSNSLKESSFQFHPLHVTVLNFSEEYRRCCIMNGETFTAFLPTWFFTDDGLSSSDGKCTRAQKLRLFHQSIDLVLSDLKDSSHSGFSCIDKEGTNRKCHPFLANYCCDLPESKDLASVKNGNRSLRNCHRCHAETFNFNKYTNSDTRRVRDTVSHIARSSLYRRNGQKEEADAILREYSLREQIPSLSTFPFVGIHPTLDLSAVLTFEPLHGLHLGVSRTLKLCLASRLRSNDLITSSLPTKTGKLRQVSFSVIRMTVLNGINKMLVHIHHNSPAKGLSTTFDGLWKGSGGNGLYTEDGSLVGMLQGKEYKSLDMIFPFIGMFLDRCCDEVENAPSTTVFVQYVDIMQTALSYRNNSSWTEESVKKLENNIKKFKHNASQLYSDFHASSLCTEKFHMLDHIGQDIRRMGGLTFGDAGLFEYTHTLVKKAYRSGSKRTTMGLDETINLFMKEMNHLSIQAKGVGKNISEQNTNETNDNNAKKIFANAEARRTDCATLVKQGRKILLTELEKARSVSRSGRKAKENFDAVNVQKYKNVWEQFSVDVRQLVSEIGEDACRILQKQLLKKFLSTDPQRTNGESWSFSRVLSGWVSGIPAPTLEDYNKKGNTIRITNSALCTIQRFVSGRGFYNSKILRQDCVLIEGNDRRKNANPCLWVAKVLTLLRLNAAKEIGNRNEEGQTEYAFVQYFDSICSEDTIDKKLGCICLKWATGDNELNFEGSKGTRIDPHRKWYDLLPVSSIRGVAHVVRRDYGLSGRSATLDMDKVSWYQQSFYINRFYNDPQKTMHENIKDQQQ